MPSSPQPSSWMSWVSSGVGHLCFALLFLSLVEWSSVEWSSLDCLQPLLSEWPSLSGPFHHSSGLSPAKHEGGIIHPIRLSALLHSEHLVYSMCLKCVCVVCCVANTNPWCSGHARRQCQPSIPCRQMTDTLNVVDVDHLQREFWRK